ncbi:MAG: RNA polymerase sigma factor [Thermoleophilaceae bacterium]
MPPRARARPGSRSSQAADGDWSQACEVCLRETTRVLRDRRDAEEAAQEALLRAWRYRGGRRGPAGRRAWLARIARNEALRRLNQRERVDRNEAPGEPEAGAGDGHGELERTLDRLALARVVSLLAEDEKQLLCLRYVEDLSQPQIAERLGLPEGTVKVRLHRMRGKLRRLSDQMDGGT